MSTQTHARIQERTGPLGVWLRGAKKLETFLEDRFESLGYHVGSRPKMTLAVVFIFSLVGMFGLSQVNVVSKGDKLWTPQNSIPIAHRDYITSVDTFGAGSLLQEVILFSRSKLSPANLLSMAAVNEMMTLWTGLKQLQVPRGPGQQPDQLESLCVRKTLPTGGQGDCLLFDSIIDFWSANATLFQTQVTSEATLLTAVSASVLPGGRQVNRNNMFGDLQVDGAGNPVSAHAIGLNFLTRSELESRSLVWEKTALDFILARRDTLRAANSPFAIAVRLSRSLDDELLRSVSGDIPLLVATYGLMTLFVCLTLGKFHRVRGRVSLSLQGILMIIIATLTSFGFCSWAGVPFISLHQILPFILVGVGVDDMYIVVAAFNLTPKRWDLPRRMAATLKDAGITVSVTSFTNAMAFALGSSSVIPAIQYFCQYASLSIMMIYCFCLTAFCALIALDEARQQAHRLDGCLCCFTSQASIMEAEEEEAQRQTRKEQRKAQELELGRLNPAASPAAMQTPQYSSNQDINTILPNAVPPLSPDTVGKVFMQKQQEDEEHNRSVTESWSPGASSAHLSWSARFMRDRYAPFLMQPFVKAFVVLAFVGFLGLNIYWTTQLTEGFELVDVTPDNSYTRDFFDVEEFYYKERELGLSLYFRALDYHTAETQQAIQTFTSQMLASPWTAGPVISWLPPFQQYYRTTAPFNSSLDAQLYLTDKTTFYQALESFLQRPQALAFNSDLHWSDATRTLITASRVHLFHTPLKTTEERKNMLVDLRDIAEASPLNQGKGGKDGNAFAYNPFYIFFESFLYFYKELIANFLLSGAAVICICLILLTHPGAIPFLVIVIGMIDVDLLGAIHMWNLQVNSITSIQLVMATGLIVDYSAHVMHAFLKHEGTRDERVSKSLASMGSSIIMGGLTSFLGVVPLVVSNSNIFRTFFRMFFCIVVYGLVHGLVLLPVLLSYWGPELVPPEEEEPAEDPALKSRPEDRDMNMKVPATDAHTENIHV